MNKYVYVTGNSNKAKYFSELINIDIDHHKVDVSEIQSLDLDEVVTEKAKAAYAELGRPVIIEDTALIIHCLGRLPGTFIKWFIEEIGLEKICRLADGSTDRSATATAAYAVYDGSVCKIFRSELGGRIANKPRGDESFGWNPLFIPDGHDETLGEMDEVSFQAIYRRIKPIKQVALYLQSLDSISE